MVRRCNISRPITCGLGKRVSDIPWTAVGQSLNHCLAVKPPRAMRAAERNWGVPMMPDARRRAPDVVEYPVFADSQSNLRFLRIPGGSRFPYRVLLLKRPPVWIRSAAEVPEFRWSSTTPHNHLVMSWQTPHRCVVFVNRSQLLTETPHQVV